MKREQKLMAIWILTLVGSLENKCRDRKRPGMV